MPGWMQKSISKGKASALDSIVDYIKKNNV